RPLQAEARVHADLETQQHTAPGRGDRPPDREVGSEDDQALHIEARIIAPGELEDRPLPRGSAREQIGCDQRARHARLPQVRDGALEVVDAGEEDPWLRERAGTGDRGIGRRHAFAPVHLRHDRRGAQEGEQHCNDDPRRRRRTAEAHTRSRGCSPAGRREAFGMPDDPRPPEPPDTPERGPTPHRPGWTHPGPPSPPPDLVTARHRRMVALGETKGRIALRTRRATIPWRRRACQAFLRPDRTKCNILSHESHTISWTEYCSPRNFRSTPRPAAPSPPATPAPAFPPRRGSRNGTNPPARNCPAEGAPFVGRCAGARRASDGARTRPGAAPPTRELRPRRTARPGPAALGGPNQAPLGSGTGARITTGWARSGGRPVTGNRRAQDAIGAFADIASVLAESLELPEVLRRIASTVLTLSAADSVSVLLRRDGEAELVVHERSVGGPRLRPGYRFPVQPQVLKLLERRRTPLVIRGVQASPLVPDEIRRQTVVRDAVIVPLRVENELIGAMSIAYRELPQRWPLAPALLTALADHMAVAVRTAQLVGEARRSSEQLQQSEKLSALGRLIARVAHELNKPLTATRLLLEMLEADNPPSNILSHVRAIARETERAAAIVADLLLLARKRDREFTAVPLASVVREALGDHARDLSSADVGVALDLPADLPPVYADRRGLHHALSNLVLNAVQAMAKSEQPNRRITIRAWLEPAPTTEPRAEDQPDPSGTARDRVVLTIADTGPGIRPDALPHIFEPFFTTKPAGEGTGMGLAIVKEFVDAIGGEVHAE